MTPDHIVERFKEQSGEILALKAIVIVLLADNPRLRLSDGHVRDQILGMRSGYGVADFIEVQAYARATLAELLGRKMVRRAVTPKRRAHKA